MASGLTPFLGRGVGASTEMTSHGIHSVRLTAAESPPQAIAAPVAIKQCDFLDAEMRIREACARGTLPFGFDLSPQRAG